MNTLYHLYYYHNAQITIKPHNNAFIITAVKNKVTIYQIVVSDLNTKVIIPYQPLNWIVKEILLPLNYY